MIKTLNIRERIAETLLIMLGICFILSGVMKAVNVYSFAQEIRRYIEAYLIDLLLPWTVEIALIICAIETTIGLMTLGKKYKLMVSVCFLGLMSFFFWLTGINLFLPSVFGSIESCGCFGEFIHFSAVGSFIKCIVLFIMSLALFFILIKNGEHLHIHDLLKDCNVPIIFMAGLSLPLYSYLCFERLESGYYLVGFVVLALFLLIVMVHRYSHNEKNN